MWAPADFRRMYPNGSGSRGRTVQFQVTGAEQNFEERFPDAVGLQYWDVTVGPGDMLFIPAFMIHQVTAVDVAISMNVFFGNDGTHSYVEKILQPPIRGAFEFWLCNIIEQNRQMDSFPNYLAYLPRVLYGFMRKQFREEITKEQQADLTQLVCNYLGLDPAALPRAADYDTRKHPPVLKIRGLLFRDTKKSGGG